MNLTEIAALRDQLIAHEGLRLKPYHCTAGKLTIGCGRNLDDVGISHAEAMVLLDNDIDEVLRDLFATYPWFKSLDAIRQRAVADLRFQLGKRGLAAFGKCLAALSRHDYGTAADELVLSKWYRQVGDRGPRIVHMVRTGTQV